MTLQSMSKSVERDQAVPASVLNDTHERRERVLAAALSLFTTRGYFNTSIQDIRAAADVSTGFIYHHFSSKEEVARALYQKLLMRLADGVGRIADSEATLAARSRRIIAFFFSLADESPEVMAFILHARHREFLPEEKPICSSAPFTMMLDMVREGIRAGEVRPVEAVVAATTLFGGAIRMIHLLLDGAICGPLTPMADQVWQCAWNGVGRQGAGDDRPRETEKRGR